MRVVLLVTDLQRGGTPLRLVRLARSLAAYDGAASDPRAPAFRPGAQPRHAPAAAERINVHVGCLAAPGPLNETLTQAGIPNFACGARHARDISALWRLTARLREIGPDLVHSTLTHANLAARFACRRLGIPHIGATATIEVERRWQRLAERWTIRLDRLHIVNSPAVRDHVVNVFGMPRERVRIVPPSVEPHPADASTREALRNELGLRHEDFVVVWTGRFDQVKRLDLLIRCAELLHDRPMHFVLAGDGPLHDALSQQIKASPARDRIHLLGWRSNIPALLAAGDAFLFPSLTEGMPNAVLEAMAAGLPIVASDLPVLRPIADDGFCLRLINSPDAAPYAAALRQLHDDPALRKQLGAAARAWAQKYLSPAATVEAALRIYAEVLAAQSS